MNPTFPVSSPDRWANQPGAVDWRVIFCISGKGRSGFESEKKAGGKNENGV